MDKILNNFRKKLSNGEGLIGPFMKTGDPAFVECAGFGGFDFAILDMEHGPMNVLQLQNLIRAAQCSNIMPIVRVPDYSESSIGKALDVGALGIQVPQVTNSDTAKEAIRVAKFAPQGDRGVCRYVRAAKYTATDRYEYFKNANDNIVILQLEGNDAINNIDDILEVEGIDIIFIGPYDLSQSLGYPGQVDHPEVINKMKFIVNKAKSKNIAVGIFVDDLKAAKMWREQGIQYISYSVDVGMFYEQCKNIVNDFR